MPSEYEKENHVNALIFKALQELNFSLECDRIHNSCWSIQVCMDHPDTWLCLVTPCVHGLPVGAAQMCTLQELYAILQEYECRVNAYGSN